MMKNIGKSIRARLLNLSRDEHQDYMKILVRYLHERLLYRISISPYKNNFLLKGSSLLFAFNKFNTRPTVDIDLLGEHIDRDCNNLLMVFKNICNIDCEEDGVSFDTNSLSSEPIAVDKKYPGSCITVTAHLDTIVQRVSVDIGFGDVVTPFPLSLDYPLLLENIPAVELYAYSLETLVAEKFHAMIERDESNSRMKDFFDVYFIFKNHTIDEKVLKEAIINTFSNRGTSYNRNVKLFTNEFATDKLRATAWNAFLKKIRWKENIAFAEVMNTVKENLERYWEDVTFARNNA